MRILAFGSYDLRAHPRVGVLIDGLREHGADVREVNVPLGLTTAQRVQMLREPWRLPLFAARLGGRWATLARQGRRMAAQWEPDAVLVGYLGHFDVLLARKLFPHSTIVLDHLIFAANTAVDRGASGKLTQQVLTRLDRAAIEAADVVVLDTVDHQELLARLVPHAAAKALVAPVGAGSAWFDAGAARPVVSPQRDSTTTPAEQLSVVFFGLYTPLQGAPVIGAAISQLAGEPIRFTMIGTGQDIAATRAAVGATTSQVTWLDWVDADDLPQLVAAHDVCLGIFGTGDKALRVVPNKVYQGAAAGCAVLTSDTRSQRAALAGAGVLVPPGDAAALADALRQLVGNRASLTQLQDAARQRALSAFTAEAVSTQLYQRLENSVITSMSGTTSPGASATDTMAAMTASTPSTQPPAQPPAHPEVRSGVSAPPLAPRAWLRYDVVRGILDRLAPATILEMGCGQGSFGARMAQQATYLGIEPDEQAASVARSRIAPHGGTVITGDQHDVPAGATYDLVCAFEVLEHLPNDEEMLRVWASFVRPGGHLLLSVPAWQDRFGPMDTHAGHYRRYSPDEIEALLRSVGLTTATTTVYGWPLGYALEAVRNRIDARKLDAGASELSMSERTASTGRTFQPSTRRVATMVAVAVTPFRYLQRLAPERGTGLVTLARRPS